MELVNFLLANAVEIIEAFAAFVAFLVLAAKITPNQDDDSRIAKFQDKVDVVLDLLKSRRNG